MNPRETRHAPLASARACVMLLGLLCLLVASAANAVQNIWTGGGDGTWDDLNNWSLGRVPLSSDEVVFNGTGNTPATIDATFTVASLTVTNGFTNAITQQAEGTVSGNFGIFSGVWRFTSGTAGGLAVNGNMLVASSIQCQRLSLAGNGTGRVFTVAGDLTVTSNGTFYALGMGFNPGPASSTPAPNSGPGQGLRAGNGGPYYGSGAGHGGQGGDSRHSTNWKVGGMPYGSIKTPIALGSGGGWGHYDPQNGYGGGAIQLNVGGDVTVDGTITVDGHSAADLDAGAEWSGGGSGGSILISCDSFSGNGNITADGGDWSSGYGGGGSGGRISVSYTNTTYTGLIRCRGGYSGYYSGSAGTVYMRKTTEPTGTVIVDNGGRAATQKTLVTSNVTDTTVGSLVLRNVGKFDIAAGQSFTILNDLTNDATFSLAGGVFRIAGTGTSVVAGVSATTTFYDLVCTNAGKQVTFAAGNTYVINNIMTANGGSGDLVRFRSTTTNHWYLTLPPKLHSLSYLDVEWSDASSGITAAAYDSLDSGSNVNWSFASLGATNTWIGVTSTSWQEPSNWDLGRIAVSTDLLTISNGCSFYPVMDTDKQFVGLKILSGGSLSLNGYDLMITGNVTMAGTLIASASETVTFRSDIDLTGGDITEATSTLKIGGTSDQLVSLADESLYRILVTNTAGTVAFDDSFSVTNLVNDGGTLVFSNAIAVGSLDHDGGSLTFEGSLTVDVYSGQTGDVSFLGDVNAGTFNSWVGPVTLTFGANTTCTVDRVAFYGSISNMVTLRSSAPTTAWYLNAAECVYVSYVDVQDSDASGGVTIRAFNSTNSLRNTNWNFVLPGVSLTWNGSVSTEFTNSANWTPSAVPTATNTLVFDGLHSFSPTLSTQAVVSNMFVGGPQSVTLTANAALSLLDSVYVLEKGAITHSANNDEPATYRLRLNVTNDVVVYGGIDVEGKGYRPATTTDGFGPGGGHRGGNGGPFYGSGAGHGGSGGNSSSGGTLALGGICYGSITAPVDPGSGAGFGHYNELGWGGGVIRLVVGGTVRCIGRISADGRDSDLYAGGGSGGSVYITCKTMAGEGNITADGGQSRSAGGDGGGGRIAAYFATNSLTGRISAYGGTGSNNKGGAGSVYLKDDGVTYGTLIVDNNGSSATAKMVLSTNVTEDSIENILIRNAGKVHVPADRTFSVFGFFTNNASHTFTSGTIMFSGDQTSGIGGSTTTTFYDLTCTNAGKRLEFAEGHTVVIANQLRLEGVATNRIVLRSTTTNQWNLNLAPVIHTINFVDVADSDASSGSTAAAFDSIDSGDNVNWSFAVPGETNTWIGGTSTDWQEVSNWDLNRAPVYTDFINISNGCSFYPIMDIDKEFAGLWIFSGGSMSLGGYDLIVNGAVVIEGTLTATGTETMFFRDDLSLTGGSITPATSTLVLGGSSNQCVISDGDGFYQIRVTNQSASVTFVGDFAATNFDNMGGTLIFSNTVGVGVFDQDGGSLTFHDHFNVDTYSANAGDVAFLAGVTAGKLDSWIGSVTLTFGAGTTCTADRVAFYGSDGKLVTLRSSTPGAAWRLVAAESTYVSYVDAQDSDASGGATILAVNSTDSLRNTNWIFVSTGESRTWHGAVSSEFTNSANWSPASVPGETNLVILDGYHTNAPVISSPTVVSNLIVGGPQAVTLTANGELTVRDTITVLENGTITHSANNAEPATYKMRLNVTNDIVVYGKIDVGGKGYRAASATDGLGPGGGHRGGNGGPFYGSGAGHGGDGGYSSSGATLALGGTCYGSITVPTDPGSGGGYGHYNPQMGHGGGVIRLLVSGELRCEGSVSADGANANLPYYGGGGSGGSIYITCGTLTGDGNVTADGGRGSGWAADGGGGRVAVYFGTNTIKGRISAYGGAGSNHKGAGGSVYLKGNAWTNGVLIVDNNGISTTAKSVISADVTNTVVDDVVLTGNSRFHLDTDQTLTVCGSWSNGATFTAGTNSTLLLDTTRAMTIWGNSTFYRFKSTTKDKIISFAAGSENTVAGDLFLEGVTLLSTVEGSPWYLTLQAGATQEVYLVRVQDSDASNGVPITAVMSGNMGGNVNWLFPLPSGTIITIR